MHTPAISARWTGNSRSAIATRFVQTHLTRGRSHEGYAQVYIGVITVSHRVDLPTRSGGKEERTGKPLRVHWDHKAPRRNHEEKEDCTQHHEPRRRRFWVADHVQEHLARTSGSIEAVVDSDSILRLGICEEIDVQQGERGSSVDTLLV